MSKLTLHLMVIFTSTVFSQNVGEKYAININNIYLPLNNSGVLADVDIGPLGSGGQFDGHGFLFASGFLLSGYQGDSLWTNGVASAGLITDYLPGTVTIPPADPKAALYKLHSNDPDFSQSWQDWTDAVVMGADFYDGDGDGIYNPIDLNANGIWDPEEDKPDLLGDITLWCVYNDSEPSSNRRWDVDPLGIEIQQTVFAFSKTQGATANTIFIRYRIKNTGLVENVLDSVYFSLYADPDIGNHTDDIGGCDTIRNANIAYKDGPDDLFGNNPPSFFMKFLAGPVVYISGVTFIDNNGNEIFEKGIDTPLDTAYIRNGPLGVRVFVGAKNLDMSSSVNYPDGDPNFGDPGPDAVKARNIMLGYSREGNVIDPCNWPYGEVKGGILCNEVNPFYWFSGDPVTDIGWISVSPDDLRSISTLGPFKLNKSNPVEIFTAYIVGRGSDHFNSIEIAREFSDEIKELFDNNLGYPIVLSVDDVTTVDNFYLSQNYPNPFNPTTSIQYAIGSRQFVILEVYDALGSEVATLVNEEKPAGTYEVELDGINLTSGIYFYHLRAGNYIETKKMILLK